MGLKVGTLLAELELSTKRFQTQMAAVQSRGFLPVTKGAVAAGAAVAAAFAVSAVKIGNSFDEAYKSIRASTGATGKALEGLKGDFRKVAAGSEHDFESIATVIGDLNRRTGATGKRLQELARAELDLARMTKTDVGETVRLTTRLFGDWSVKTEQQTEVLNQLWRATQMTGISLTDLTSIAVQFGAPLRQMGFSLQDTIAMLSKWEKEGVNVVTALTGIRFALKTFADEGVDPARGFRDVYRAVKNAKTETEAFAEGVKVFGLRAGPDMVAAIREGRFAYEDLREKIENSNETIGRAAEQTQTLGDTWREVKSALTVAFEPVAMVALDKIKDAGVRLSRWMREHRGQIDDFFTAIGDAAQRAYDLVNPLLRAFGGLVGLVEEVAYEYSRLENTPEGDQRARARDRYAGAYYRARPYIVGDPKQTQNVEQARRAVERLGKSIETVQKIAAKWPDVVPKGTTERVLLSLQGALGRWRARYSQLFQQARADAREGGEGFASGLEEGVLGQVGQIVAASVRAGRSAREGTRKGLGDGSEAGKAFGEQLVSGLGGKRGEAQRAGRGVGVSAARGARGGIGDGRPTGSGFGKQLAGGLGSQQGAARSAGRRVGWGGRSGARSGLGNGYGIGQNFGRSVANGIESMFAVGALAGAMLASRIESAVRSRLKQRSPSQVGVDIGQTFTESVALGMTRGTPSLDTAALSVAMTVASVARKIERVIRKAIPPGRARKRFRATAGIAGLINEMLSNIIGGAEALEEVARHGLAIDPSRLKAVAQLVVKQAVAAAGAVAAELNRAFPKRSKWVGRGKKRKKKTWRKGAAAFEELAEISGPIGEMLGLLGSTVGLLESMAEVDPGVLSAPAAVWGKLTTVIRDMVATVTAQLSGLQIPSGLLLTLARVRELAEALSAVVRTMSDVIDLENGPGSRSGNPWGNLMGAVRAMSVHAGGLLPLGGASLRLATAAPTQVNETYVVNIGRAYVQSPTQAQNLANLVIREIARQKKRLRRHG